MTRPLARPDDTPPHQQDILSIPDRLIAEIRIREQFNISQHGAAQLTFDGQNPLPQARLNAVSMAMYLMQVELELADPRRANFAEAARLLESYGMNGAKRSEALPDGLRSFFVAEDADRAAAFLQWMAVQEVPDRKDFFVANRTYVHAAEGVFRVEYVGYPPKGFEDPSEMLGVASGWRKDAGPDAVGAGASGAYQTPDFYGWELQR